MKIERRKLSYNKQRDQVVTTLNAEFLREVGIDPDSHVNIIYEDIHKVAVICGEENLNHVIETRTVVNQLLKEYTCGTCGSVNLDKRCRKCNTIENKNEG